MSWSDAPYAWYSDASDYSNVQTDDARRCQVEGCYKKHAFVRLSGNRKVYSKFCAERMSSFRSGKGLRTARLT